MRKISVLICVVLTLVIVTPFLAILWGANSSPQQTQAVADMEKELVAVQPGDILVFNDGGLGLVKNISRNGIFYHRAQGFDEELFPKLLLGHVTKVVKFDLEVPSLEWKNAALTYVKQESGVMIGIPVADSQPTSAPAP